MYLDESRPVLPHEVRPVTSDKVRFDAEKVEQTKDRDSGTGTFPATTDERSTTSRVTKTYRIRQQLSSDSSLNALPKKKTEKIRIKDSLNILESYHARYRIRSGGKI